MQMDSSQIDSPDDQQTFHLIRLPRETVERARNGSCKVGTLFVHDDGSADFQDNHSREIYTLLRNCPIGSDSSRANSNSGGSSQKRSSYTAAFIDRMASSNETDLLKISLQKDEALHLGKVKTSTLLAAPKGDETNVSTAS